MEYVSDNWFPTNQNKIIIVVNSTFISLAYIVAYIPTRVNIYISVESES